MCLQTILRINQIRILLNCPSKSHQKHEETSNKVSAKVQYCLLKTDMYEVCLRIDAAILEYSELKQLTH